MKLDQIKEADDSLPLNKVHSQPRLFVCTKASVDDPVHDQGFKCEGRQSLLLAVNLVKPPSPFSRTLTSFGKHQISVLYH